MSPNNWKELQQLESFSRQEADPDADGESMQISYWNAVLTGRESGLRNNNKKINKWVGPILPLLLRLIWKEFSLWRVVVA